MKRLFAFLFVVLASCSSPTKPTGDRIGVYYWVDVSLPNNTEYDSAQVWLFHNLLVGVALPGDTSTVNYPLSDSMNLEACVFRNGSKVIAKVEHLIVTRDTVWGL